MAKKKTKQEASDLFEAIIKASVKDSPKPNKSKSSKDSKRKQKRED